MNKVQRFLALRIIAALRTVSFEADTVLARVPPVFLLAEQQRRVFEKLRDLKRKNEWSADIEKEMRIQEYMRLKRRWKTHLQSGDLAGARVREAILSILNDWMERQHGRMTFHLTQVITGHGCLGDYLHKIGKRQTNSCDHCGTRADTAQHTIEHCVAWSVERDEMKENVRQDLSLPALLKVMTDNKPAWNAEAKFAGIAMAKKEEAERARDRAKAEMERHAVPQAGATNSTHRESSSEG